MGGGAVQAIAMIKRIEKASRVERNSHYRKPSKAILEKKNSGHENSGNSGNQNSTNGKTN